MAGKPGRSGDHSKALKACKADTVAKAWSLTQRYLNSTDVTLHDKMQYISKLTSSDMKIDATRIEQTEGAALLAALLDKAHLLAVEREKLNAPKDITYDCSET